MRRPSIKSALIALLLVFTATGTYAQDQQQVQEDVRARTEAFFKGDIDTVLIYTHPAVIDGYGGYIATEQILKRALQPVLAQGIKLESFSFPAAPNFLEAGERRFAVIPTVSVLIGGGQRTESRNFQFGVLEPGAKRWTYLEGALMKPAVLKQLFPEFPADYSFPAIQRRKL